MRSSIEFGSKRIEYSLVFNHRKTLGITVKPDLAVEVKAPTGSSTEKIERLLRKRAGWILRQKDFFLAYYPKQPIKKYVGGETHLYLGKQYRLLTRRGSIESVKLSGKFFNVTSRRKQDVKSLLKEWYWFHAGWKFKEIAHEYLPRFQNVDFDPNQLEIREMSKRWGSCTPRRRIILNIELIKAPRGCIEYVIAHELCHLVHRNHNRKFIGLQTRIMPDWMRWKDILERFLA